MSKRASETREQTLHRQEHSWTHMISINTYHLACAEGSALQFCSFFIEAMGEPTGNEATSPHHNKQKLNTKHVAYTYHSCTWIYGKRYINSWPVMQVEEGTLIESGNRAQLHLSPPLTFAAQKQGTTIEQFLMNILHSMHFRLSLHTDFTAL